MKDPYVAPSEGETETSGCASPPSRLQLLLARFEALIGIFVMVTSALALLALPFLDVPDGSGFKPEGYFVLPIAIGFGACILWMSRQLRNGKWLPQLGWIGIIAVREILYVLMT